MSASKGAAAAATVRSGSTTTAAAATTNVPVPQPNTDNARYYYNEKKLEAFKKSKPWMQDAMYFKNVTMSPTAVMKIMMHCASGVEKGLAQGGNPVEVMGFLLGRPDPATPTTLVVTDAFPLPIEGFETRVIADDENVVNHMISLGESLERTRQERFMGWYHSHPFDLSDRDHCFLSQTDLSTQLQWQRAEDPHGNPFCAVVVDPLRSAATGVPVLRAFRAFPPEYSAVVAQTCPDGTVEHREQVRLEKWGSCWNRYYELSTDYFMSQTSRDVMQRLTSDYLWMRTLTGGGGGGGGSSSSSHNDADDPELAAVVERLQTSNTQSTQATSAAAAAAAGSSMAVGSSRELFGNAALDLEKLADQRAAQAQLETVKDELFA